MKKLTLILFAAVVVFGCKQQQRPDVVERPVFEVWNSTTIEIDKIELNDTATILHIDAFFTPNWWIRIDSETYIRESDTDERLILTHAEGIAIDEHHYMPESGESSFKLYFPPLPQNVTKIDFIESDCDDCFKIWGISLLPGTKVSVDRSFKRQATSDSGAGLPPMVFSTEPARVKGRINGFRDGMRQFVDLNFINIIALESQDIKFEIQSDGTFEGEVNPGIPVMASSRWLGPVALTPGEETVINVDLMRKSRFESRYRTDKEESDTLHIFQSGWGLDASDFQILANYAKRGIDYDQLFKDAVGMNPVDLKDYIYAKMDALQSEISDKNLSESLQQLIYSNPLTSYFSILMNSESFLKQAHFQANNIPFEEWHTFEFEIEQPDEEYYNFTNYLWSNSLGYQMEFPYVVMMLRQMNREKEPLSDDISDDEVFSYLDNYFYDLFGEKKDLLADISKGQHVMNRVAKAQFLSEDEKSMLKSSLDPAVADYIIAENNQILDIIEANKKNTNGYFTIRDIPETDEENLFETIVADYHGKVIVVDFWATWCGPCIHANEMLKPVKDELRNEDVVFVYLAAENSPIGTWNRMIQEIEGQHYRVTDQQWQFWYNQLSIQGVPTIMIFDKNGEKISRHTGFPGAGRIKEDISKGLS